MLLREITLDYIRQYPILFFKILSFKNKYKSLLVNEDTDIVIEGYPRSANTFAVAAFHISQRTSLKVARHTHAVAQLKRAVTLEIPTLVIIREPKQAILSYVIREENVTLNLAISRYLTYYKAVSQLKNAFVIAEFNEVISNYGNVISRLNKRFNTQFSLFEHTKENIEKTFINVENMERDHAEVTLSESKFGRPSSERNLKKKELAKILENPKYKAQ